ncbi:hypothetical protein CDAR_581951 [Caerostris darwini]|uniref:Uncharacterized protein n=1 Tax=Caerostris darwini TaxID=1538125 RepID=A0AAV4X6G0_9ARAC|nr:hypothetical protein CDAR_581951 [Caerostris darwini]
MTGCRFLASELLTRGLPPQQMPPTAAASRLLSWDSRWKIISNRKSLQLNGTGFAAVASTHIPVDSQI